MRSIKAKLRKSTGNATTGNNKDDWSKNDQRVWHSVAVNAPAKLAAKLSKHENVNVNKLCPSVGYSVVHYAAAKGLDDCLNVLLAHKANVGTRDVTGATSLHASARYGHKGTTTKLLASRTVNVNATDSNNCTALHFCAFEGHVECVKLIAAEKNVDIHCVDKEGRTVLMVAAAMGRLDVCKVLIELGINVNHNDQSLLKHSALTLAAEAGHCDVVRLLCDNGADYNYKLTDGRSALDMARSRSRRSVVDALHIIQLTEAAKKSDKGLRLSSTTSTRTITDSEIRKSTENVFFSPVEEKVAEEIQQKTSNIKIVSSPNQQPNNTVLSMYNDSKTTNLYDRDISMYDSKSTLASLSSLDVSVEPVNKSYNHDVQHKLESTPKNNLSMELSQKEAEISHLRAEKDNEIVHLRAQVEGIRNISRDLEYYKTCFSKSEANVKKLEQEKKFLSSEKQNLEVANDNLQNRVANLQISNNKLHDSEDKVKKLEKKLKENEFEINRNILQLETTKAHNEQICDNYQKEQEKNDQQYQSLNQVLTEFGLEYNKDFQTNLEALKQEIKQVSQLRKKEKESGQERKVEIEKLQKTTIQQATSLEEVKSKLLDSDAELKKQINENEKLNNLIEDLKETIKGNEVIQKTQSSTIKSLEENVKMLQNQLAGKAGDVTIIEELQQELNYQKEVSEECKNLLLESKKNVKTLVEKHKNELETLTCEKMTAKKEAVDHEKTISELRVQRNQREAKISALEKSMEHDVIKLKELEVESNRARQELTEVKQRVNKLQDETAILRKSRKDLTAKLVLSKIQGSSELDKGKVDSIKSQLEHLCNHIQESEKKYKDTIAVYRNHLLKAAKGELNPEVLLALKEIIKNREEPNSSQPS